LLKETTGAFDGVQTHDWPITCQTRYRLCQASPSIMHFVWQVSNSEIVTAD